MMRWWRELDRILRGDATRASELSRGTLDVPVGGLSLVLLILALTYGACMGSFALFKEGGPSFWQLVASTVKVPALFVLTLGITLPSLYVFNALVGSKLPLDAVMKLLVAALGVMMAVLASIGPIVFFFSVSTTSYPFMVLVNVAVFAASGALGLAFLLQTLQRLSDAMRPADTSPESEPIALQNLQRLSDAIRPGDPAPEPEPLALGERRPVTLGALEPEEGQVLGRHVKTVFRIWVVLFGLVGAQMGWVLRPFIGNPKVAFFWFRPRQSNFFQAVLNALGSLFS